jgi:hypothetical protein
LTGVKKSYHNTSGSAHYSNKIWQFVDITKYMTHNFKEGNKIYDLMKLSLAKIVLLLTDERISNEHWWIDIKTQRKTCHSTTLPTNNPT